MSVTEKNKFLEMRRSTPHWHDATLQLCVLSEREALATLLRTLHIDVPEEQYED